MREHLLGYLIGALEPHETQEVEKSLRQDEQLRRELDALRSCLYPLAADEGHLDPPSGLAVQTCHYVATRLATPAARTSPAASRGWSLADVLTVACVAAAAALVFFPAVS